MPELVQHFWWNGNFIDGRQANNKTRRQWSNKENSRHLFPPSWSLTCFVVVVVLNLQMFQEWSKTYKTKNHPKNPTPNTERIVSLNYTFRSNTWNVCFVCIFLCHSWILNVFASFVTEQQKAKSVKNERLNTQDRTEYGKFEFCTIFLQKWNHSLLYSMKRSTECIKYFNKFIVCFLFIFSDLDLDLHFLFREDFHNLQQPN